MQLAGELDASRMGLEERIATTQRELHRSQDQVRELQQDVTSLAATFKADHLLAWLSEGTIGRGDAIELAEPWRIDGWRQARSRVFIQALKLYQTFFELEASRLRSNLFVRQAHV